jgi:hypothetical protein
VPPITVSDRTGIAGTVGNGQEWVDGDGETLGSVDSVCEGRGDGNKGIELFSQVNSKITLPPESFIIHRHTLIDLEMLALDYLWDAARL